MDKAGHIGELLLRARTEQRLIARDVAAKTGEKISTAAISKIERGLAEPLIGTAWLLAKALGLSLDDLMCELEEGSIERKATRMVFSIPLVPWSKIEDLMAPPSDWSGSIFPSIPSIEKHGSGAFAFVVESDAMQAAQGFCYPEGATVIVDPEAPVVAGSAVIARLNDTKEVFFRQISKDGHRHYLRALNPSMPTIESGANTTIIGVVVGMLWRKVS